MLGQYLSPPQAYTSFLALPKSSQHSRHRELQRDSHAWSASSTRSTSRRREVVSEFIKLERADASKVVDMLKEVFDKGNQPPGPSLAPAGACVQYVRGVPARPATADRPV